MNSLVFSVPETTRIRHRTLRRIRPKTCTVAYRSRRPPRPRPPPPTLMVQIEHRKRGVHCRSPLGSRLLLVAVLLATCA